MARRRKRAGRGRKLLALLVAGLLIAGVWYLSTQRKLAWPSLQTGQVPAGAEPARKVTASKVDAANEGRLIRIEGALRVTQGARDRELGISVDALALVREVQMRQWRETCAGNVCTHALVWSAQPVDSDGFREPQGHVNSQHFPFASTRYLASEVRLGAFSVEPVADLADGAALPHAVELKDLPANLALSFRAEDGVLYTGDPAHPAVGDLRVSYAIIPVRSRTLEGVQRGSRLLITR